MLEAHSRGGKDEIREKPPALSCRLHLELMQSHGTEEVTSKLAFQ